MNRNWIRKDQEGVSPVIATILMVAITVVLAAVVYLMVGIIDTGQEPPVSGTITLGLEGSSTLEVRFGAFSDTLMAVDCGVQVSNGTATTVYSYDDATKSFVAVAGDPAHTGETLTFYDLGDDGEVSIGDYLLIPIQRGNDYKVRIVVNNNEATSEDFNT